MIRGYSGLSSPPNMGKISGMEEELQQIEQWKEALIVYVAQNGVRLLVAALIVVAGVFLGRFLAMFIRGICEKRKLDVTLAGFFAGLTKLTVIAFALIMALSKVGIEISPFIALLGASAFGLTLALQGPVSNYGAGLAIILTRPFKVGDTLNVTGQAGLVDEISLGVTRLVNEDEQVITIPNRKILGEILTNSHSYSIVESSVGIAYGADPEAAITVIAEALKTVPGLAGNKQPLVGIDNFGDSSVNIGYRVWVSTQTYHASRYAANMAVWKALKDAGIGIPFPQREIRILGKEQAQP